MTVVSGWQLLSASDSFAGDGFGISVVIAQLALIIVAVSYFAFLRKPSDDAGRYNT